MEFDFEIKKREVVKPVYAKDFKRQKHGTLSSQSSEYLKTCYIPYLKLKLTNQKKLINKLRNDKLEIRASKKKAVSKVKNQQWNKCKRAYKITQGTLNQRAEEWFYDKMKVWRLKSSTSLHGITAFPILSNWAFQYGLPYQHLALLILMTYFRWFQNKDAFVFGFSKNTVQAGNLNLRNLGLVEKFTGMKNAYVLSVKGRTFVKNMMKDYNMQTKTILKEFDKKYSNRSGGTRVKMGERRLYRIKDIYNEPTVTVK